MLQNWLQHHKFIVFLLIGDIVVNIGYDFVLNIISNALLIYLKSFLLITILLIPLLYIARKQFNKLSEQVTPGKSASPVSPHSPPRESQTPDVHQQYRKSTISESVLREPAQLHSASPTASRPANQELPPAMDDNDSDEQPFINDPLPEKPRKVVVPSARELIAALPLMNFEERSRKTLPEGPKMVYWSCPDRDCRNGHAESDMHSW